MNLPTEPGAYWHPDVNLSEVWGLQNDGRWHYNITGEFVSPHQVPSDLVFLAHYKTS